MPDAQVSDLLPEDVLTQLVSRFGARAEHNPDSSIRFPLNRCPARVSIRGSSAPAEKVELVDVAARSLGFTSQTRFLAHDSVLVELDVPGIPRQTWSCRVVRSQIVNNGLYRVGACFENTTA